MRRSVRTYLRTVARALVAGVAMSGMVGCNGLSELTSPQPVASPIVSVALSQTTVTLGEGSSIALQFTAIDSDNRPIADRPVVWSSSNSAVADVSTAGLVTAISTGTAQIAASVDGQSAIARITVTARTVASVQITAPTTNILVGGFSQFLARTLDETGALLTGRPVSWGTSDNTIAVVDVNGLVTGIAPGNATVTATSETRSAAVGVNVSPVPVSTVQITPSRDTIVVGQATQLSATPRDSTGARLDNAVTWSSNATNIATVSSSGFVLGGVPGTATITASSGGKLNTAIVVVQARPVGSIIVSPSQSSLTVGQTVQLTVQITDNAGNLLTGRPVSYSSSSPNVAQVTSNGLVSVAAPGNATITVTSEGKTGTATIVASSSPVTSLRVDPATATLEIGGTVRLTATALDANGNVLGQRAVTWTSGAPSVVTVAADGTVRAIGAGTALIFASLEGRLATSTITVRGAVPTAVEITPAVGAVIVGQTFDLVAVVRDQTGQTIPGVVAQWSSSDNNVAIVSSTGRVRGLTIGTVSINATVNGVTAISNLTVVPVPVATVTVSLTSATLLVGQTTAATAVSRDALGGVLNGRTVSWSSANPAVATVSSTGLVTAVSLGTSAIRATVESVIGSAVASVIVGVPTTITANSAVSQSALAGAAVAAPPSVKVTDAGGTPVSGVSVTFTVTGGAGTTAPGSPASVTTNANGVASLTAWTLGAVAGANTLTGSVNGLTGSPVTFNATGTVGAPATVATNSVTTQSATIGTLVSAPPSVKVTDNVGNPVSGVVVTFTVAAGGGSISPASPATVATNANGIATLTNWRVGVILGANRVNATLAGVSGSPVVFNATGTVGLPITIAPTSLLVQSATIGTGVSAPPTVKVTDVGGNAVSGVSVLFTVLTGGGTIVPASPANVSTNASGIAALTSWTLGTTAGSNTVMAAVTGLTGSPITFTANAIAGTATTIAANSTVSQSVTAGADIPIPPSVLVTDASGNPVSGVSVTFAVLAGNGSIVPASPTVIATNTSGVATLTAWTSSTTAGANSVRATAAGLTGSPVTFSATGVAGGSTQLVVTRQPAGAVSGAVLSTQPIVQIRDANNNRTTSAAAVTVVVGTGTGTLSGTVTVNAVNGVATFTNLKITGVGAHTLSFSTTAPALTRVSSSFTVTAGSPKTIAANSILSQSAVAGAAVAVPPSVEVTDGDGNPVSGVAVVFTVASGTGVIVPVSPASVLTNASGIATLTSWTTGGTAGANSVTADVPGLTGSPVTFTATGTAGAASQLVLTTQPGGGVSGAVFSVQPVLQIQDANGNRTTSTAAVTVTKASGAGVFGGTLVVNAVNGTATFTNLSITGTGAHTLQFSTMAPALSRVSSAFTVTAGTPTQITASSALSQSATVATAVAAPPSVLVRDVGGNPVSGVTVTFAVATGNGVISPVSPASVLTNASGIATLTSWTLGNVAGANSVTATAAGLTGSPVSFSATGTVGPASVLVANSTQSQSTTVSSAVTTSPSVKVTDAVGNGVSGVNVMFTVASGGGTLVPASPAVVVTNASGVATLTSWTVGASAGANTVSASAAGLTGSPLTFTATGTVGTATTIAANSVVTQSAVVGTAVTARPSVRVSDAGNNPVSGVTVTFAVASGAGTVTPLNVNTNASGIATLTSWTLGTTVGANSVTATAAGLTGNPVTFGATGTVGAAAQLAVTVQPTGAVSGAAFTTQPKVAIRDANGNLTTSTATVTASIFSGGGTLVGTVAVAAVGGVATFANLQINTTGARVLAFTTTVPALTVNSSSFTVTAAAATTIAASSVTTQSAVAGTAVTAPPSVLVTDGANPVAGVDVTFTVTSGGGTTVAASPAVVVTNASGIATLTSWTLGDTVGANSVQATAAGLAGSPVTFNATGTVGAAAQLAVTVQPTGAVSGAAFTTQPKVAIRDANGNLTTSTATVTASIFSGGGALVGTVAVAAVGGVATFTNLQINTAGARVLKFTTTVPALAVNSSSFTVTAAAATAIVANSATTQSAIAGTAVTAPPSVLVTDGANPVAGVNVTFTVAGGGGTTVAVSPAVVVTNASGIATLTSWTLGATVGANSVQATAVGLTGSPVTFSATGTAGAAAQLVVTTPPAGAVSGAAFTTQPVVEIHDASGNLTTSTATVTASIFSGGGTLLGTAAVAAVGGVATFTNLQINTTGARVLKFTTTVPVLTVNSSSFTIAAGAPTQLAVTPQPAGAVNGAAFTTQPVVAIRDASGNLTASSATVTASVFSGAGTLVGSVAVAAVGGVATFTDLQINGTGAHVVAFTTTVPALTVNSASFTVTPAAATTMAANSMATQSTVAGTAVSAPPSVLVTDGANPVAGVNVTFTVTSGGGTTVAASPAVVVTNASGIATLTSWTLGATVGANSVRATAAGLAGSPVTFNATGTVGAAAQLAVTVQPSGAVSGAAFTTQPKVAIRDANGNLTTSTATVTASIFSGGGTLLGTATVAAVGGVATFTNLQINLAGAQTLRFATTMPALTVNANSVAVAAGAATQLVVTVQPSGAMRGAAFSTQPKVAIRDANGNLTTSTATVTASIFSGGGTLVGTVAVAAVGGVATFTNLRINTTGTRVLAFTTTVPALTVNSSSFTVAAAGASTITADSVTTQSAVAGTAVTAPPSVLVTDGANPVAGVDVTFTVTSGGGTTVAASPAVVVTNASGIATLASWTLGATIGANSVQATADSLAGSPVTFNATGTAGAAAQLVVATQPATAVSGAAFTTQPVVEIHDANGNLTSSTDTVTASMFSGGGALLGTVAVVAVGGVATFTDLQINTTGVRVVAFTTTVPALTVNSSSFTVAAGAAAQLAIFTQPAGAADGIAFTMQPVVRVLDAQGNLTASTLAVTAAIGSGTGTLGGTVTVNAVNGVATFGDLAITGTGVHTVQFGTSSPALTIVSSDITVAAFNTLFDVAFASVAYLTHTRRAP